MEHEFRAEGDLLMILMEYGWDDTNIVCRSEGEARALADLLNGHPDEDGIVRSQKELLLGRRRLSRDATVVHI